MVHGVAVVGFWSLRGVLVVMPPAMFLNPVPAEVILDVDFMQNYLLGKNAFVICQMGASQLI